MYNVHAILISSMHHVVDDLAFCEILIPACAPIVTVGSLFSKMVGVQTQGCLFPNTCMVDYTLINS